ncbi:hypothetical protein YB2330_003653 [Saitoella coloradoensis]
MSLILLGGPKRDGFGVQVLGLVRTYSPFVTTPLLVAIGGMGVYLAYGETMRRKTIRDRRRRHQEKAKKASEEQDEEAGEAEVDERERFKVYKHAGRYWNPFPEWREQGIWEWFYWKLHKLVTWNFMNPAGLPSDETVLEHTIPLYTPDFALIIEASGGKATELDETEVIALDDLVAPGQEVAEPVALDDPLSASWATMESTSSTDKPEFNSNSDETVPTLTTIPAVLAQDSAPAPEIPAVEDRIVYTWLGQSCVHVQLGSLAVLTDPVFSFSLPSDNSELPTFMKVDRIRPVPATLESLGKIDVVLVSHNHYDHLEEASVLAIGDSAEWFVPMGMKAWFNDLGVFRVTEMEWWDFAPVRSNTAFEVVAVPAMHWSARTPLDTNTTLWTGFCVMHNNENILYHAGDTGYMKDLFPLIKKNYGSPKLALLPIGAYEPRWHLCTQHIDPEDAVKIALELAAERAVGVHWGTWILSDEHYLAPVLELRKNVAKYKMQEGRFIAGEMGETVVIPWGKEMAEKKHWEYVMRKGRDGKCLVWERK